VSGPEARERLRCMELFAELRAEGCSEKSCLKAIGWSRAKYFPWHKRYREGGVRDDQPGALVQMDHMSVAFPGTTIKNFTAVKPGLGYLAACAYSRATSINAARFLEYATDAMPLAITAIQVDFGQRIEAPPSNTPANNATSPSLCCRPKAPNTTPMSNAHTARRILRPVSVSTEPASHKPRLSTYQQHYCHHRPHGGKNQNFQTPMAYYQHLKEAA